MQILSRTILQLEERILHQPFDENIAALLADDMWEIGSSGVKHSRDEICQWLKIKPADACWQLSDFKLQELSADLLLCSYRARQIAPAISASAGALHSSLWKKGEHGWQMCFHQGTKLVDK